MLCLPLLLVLTLAGERPAVPAVSVPPTAVTLAAALEALRPQTGLTLSTTLDPATPVKLDRRDGTVWAVLTDLATAAGGRLAVTADGQTVAVERGLPYPAAVDGDFRTYVTQATRRRDFDGGGTVTEVTLVTHWEPRRPVFRVASTLTGTATADGKVLPLPAGAGMVAVGGSAVTTVVRVPSLPAGVKALTLTGTFTMTAADKMLQFRATDTDTPKSLTLDGVTATFPVMARVGDRWDVPVELVYPPPTVEFESFESGVWLGRNRLQLVDAAGKPLSPVNEDWRDGPGRANGVYRFRAADVPAARPGWTLVYETPSPLVEFGVGFTLGPFELP